jgi:hypothetical protein
MMLKTISRYVVDHYAAHQNGHKNTKIQYESLKKYGLSGKPNISDKFPLLFSLALKPDHSKILT